MCQGPTQTCLGQVRAYNHNTDGWTGPSAPGSHRGRSPLPSPGIRPVAGAHYLLVSTGGALEFPSGRGGSGPEPSAGKLPVPGSLPSLSQEFALDCTLHGGPDGAEIQPLIYSPTRSAAGAQSLPYVSISILLPKISPSQPRQARVGVGRGRGRKERKGSILVEARSHLLCSRSRVSVKCCSAYVSVSLYGLSVSYPHVSVCQ